VSLDALSVLAQTPKQRDAAIVLRLFGALFLALGMANAFLVSNWSDHRVRDVTMYLFICLLGLATIFLWRWAAILLSLCSLAVAMFLLWRLSHGVSFLRTMLVVPFFLAAGSLPGLSTFYLWRSLR
jgi:hypothetical protein